MNTIYLHPEDDIAKIAQRLQEIIEPEVLLVFPKKSYLFSDSINLRLLKKQVDILKKKVFIFTMDETGQQYSKDAGFELKQLETSSASGLDVKRPSMRKKPVDVTSPKEAPVPAVKIPEPKKNTPSKIKTTEKVKVISTAPKPSYLPKPVKIEPENTTLSKIRPQKLEKPPVIAEKSADYFASNVNDNKKLSELSSSPSKNNMFGETLHQYDNGGSNIAKPKSIRLAIFSFIALVLITVVVLGVFVLPKADIVIHAKRKPLIKDIEVGLARTITAPDSAKLVMPAMELNQTLKGVKSFSSSGKKEVGSKSEGKVFIYNLTGKPLNLKASTTTLSIGGKNYFFTEDQSLLKPTSQNEETTNIATIVAEQGGEDYNAPAGTRLEITNKVFGGKPQLLYAKTQSELVGGNSRFVSYITETDISKAKEDLKSQLISQLREELKQKQQILVDNSFKTEDVEFSSDKLANTESPTFEVSSVFKLYGLVFSEEQLKDMIRSRLSETLSETEFLADPGTDLVSYRIKNADLETKVASLIVHYESAAIGKVDGASLTQEILGKSKEEAGSLLLSHDEIEKVDFTIAPGWQSSIPRFTRNVTIKVE
jgi:hypothetical protein